MKKLLLFVCYVTIYLFTSLSLSAKENTYPEIKEIKQYYKSRQVNWEQKKRIKEIIENYRDDLDFNFQLGQLFLKLYLPLEAEQIFKRLFEIQPKDKYEIGYGRALLMRHKYEEILFKINPNALTDELRSHKLMLFAHSYLGSNQPAKALMTINEALDIHPEEPAFIVFKARALTSLGRIEESIELIKQLEDMEYVSRRMLILKAENYISTGNYNQAKEIYDQVINLDDDYVDAYSGRARVNLMLNNPEKALEDGMFLVTRRPNNPIGLYIVAKALMKQGKYKRALELYDGKGDGVDFFMPGLLLEAEIHYHNQHNGRAEVLLNKYIKLDRNDPEALKFIGLLKIKSGNVYDALGYLKDANILQPDDPQILIGLAQALYLTGKYDEAEKVFYRLKKEFPQASQIAYDALSLSCHLKTVRKRNTSVCGDVTKSEISNQIFNALTYLYADNTNEAYKIISELKVTFPNEKLIDQYYPRILNADGQTDSAVNMLFEMLKKNKQDTRILTDLYSIYISGKSSIDIISRLRKFYENDLTYSNIGYYLIDFYYHNKNYVQAADITKLMISQKPKDLELYEMLLKLTTYDLKNLQGDLATYLPKYKALKPNAYEIFSMIRKSIMFHNFIGGNFSELKYPAGEKTAEDFRVFAEYLDFIGEKEAADYAYQKGMSLFSKDYTFFNSAFNFYKNHKNMVILEDLPKRFKGNNIDERILIQAKYLKEQNKLQKAIEIVTKQFLKSFDGRLGYFLLSLDPSQSHIKLVEDNIDKIQDNSYEVTFLLAKNLVKNHNFSQASDVLLRHYEQKKHSASYQFLLAKASFYNNFNFAYDMMQGLISQFPDNQEYLLQSIAFEAQNKAYDKAITLFEKFLPNQQKYPSLHFYYAYALWKQGKKDKAVKILANLLDANTDFVEKQAALEMIERFNAA